MKESYGKGVTNHTDLESCAVGREVNLEALTKACTGQPLSRERTLLQGADAVGESGRPYRRSRKREGLPNPARSKNLSMYTETTCARTGRACVYPPEVGRIASASPRT
jgi:hypothetical protein